MFQANSNPNSTSEDERTPIQICENTYVETPISKSELSQVVLSMLYHRGRKKLNYVNFLL